MSSFADALVIATQMAVLLSVAAVFWRSVSAVVLLLAGTAAVGLALIGQGWGWIPVGGLAVAAALHTLQVDFNQLRYVALDAFSLYAPPAAPTEGEVIDRNVAALERFFERRREAWTAARQERADRAAAAPAESAGPAKTAEPAAERRSERLAQRRSERLRANRHRADRMPVSAREQADPDYADPPASSETRRNRESAKESPRTVA
jgi:hypothetical protein